MDIVGNQLTAVRKLRKMSCNALSKELEHNGRSYTRNTISRKCNEKGGKTSEEAIKEIAKVLKIDADVLTEEAAFDEYMESLEECKRMAESFELDEGAIMFIKLACDYLNGKDKGNRFEYVCKLLEDEKLFKELNEEASVWRKRIDEIETMLKKKTVNLGTGAYLCLEPKKGVFYTMWRVVINDDIRRLFFMENHNIPCYRTKWIKGRLIDTTEIKKVIREHLKNYDTGSEFLNEKLKMLMEGQGVNYTMTLCNAEAQYTEEQMEQILDSLKKYIEETEGSLAE